MGTDQTGPEAERGWTIRRVLDDVESSLSAIGYPQQRKPEGVEQEYLFPDDCTKLTGQQLGTLQLRLGGWYTYLLAVLGRHETEEGVIESTFSVKLGVKMQSIADSYDRNKPNKDELKAMAIRSDPDLDMLMKALVAKRAMIKRLQIQTQVYDSQLHRLSREQSRRDAESRIS